MNEELQQSLSLKAPEGYEFTGEYRAPKLGEYYLSHYGTVCCHSGNAHMRAENTKLILREKWQWPEWLTAAYVAMDKSGEWFAYENEPKVLRDRWFDDGLVSYLSPALYSMKFPSVSDWTRSLIKNPNKE